jgi:hypothetical protein
MKDRPQIQKCFLTYTTKRGEFNCQKMQQKSDLWICYNGGSNPGTVRREKPLRWSLLFFLLLVYVEIGNKKKYFILKIVDVKNIHGLNLIQEVFFK